jgi:hypothetical protein
LTPLSRIPAQLSDGRCFGFAKQIIYCAKESQRCNNLKQSKFPECCSSDIVTWHIVRMIIHGRKLRACSTMLPLCETASTMLTIIDRVLVAAAEPGKPLDQHRAVPYLQAFHLDMDIDKFTDQLTGH